MLKAILYVLLQFILDKWHELTDQELPKTCHEYLEMEYGDKNKC